VLVVNATLPRPAVWLLFVCAALHAGLAALQRPSFEALLQKLVPLELMASVSALNLTALECDLDSGSVLGWTHTGEIRRSHCLHYRFRDVCRLASRRYL
jgi:hypothetical protein